MTRPTLERMRVIVDKVREGHANASTLAREMETSKKTIQRDIEFLRDRLLMPIEYDRHTFTYKFSHNVTGCPLCQRSKPFEFDELIPAARQASPRRPVVSTIFARLAD